MYDLALVIIASFLVYGLSVLRPTGILSANGIFVVLQIIMAIGTLALLNPRNRADEQYGYMIVLSTICYMAVSACVLIHKPPSICQHGKWTPQPRPTLLYKPGMPVGALLALSVLIVVAYYIAVGHIVLLDGLMNSFTSGNADIAGKRLEAYAGERYLFPGYVNQFKNVLLPALITVTASYWIVCRRRHLGTIAVLSCIAILGMLATGQRAAFIQFCVVLVMYLYLVNGRRLPRAVRYIATIGLLLLIVSTIALGRSNLYLSSSSSLADRSWVALLELGRRIFIDQQVSAIAGFRYIIHQPVQWGNEWLTALLGVLPGQGGSTLSNQIFASLYASDRGTSPPSIWGSAFHNFGWVGVLLTSILLAVVLGAVTRASGAARPRNTLQIMGIAGISTTLGFWVSGSPETLLNSGLAVYIVMWFWGARAQRLSESYLSCGSHRVRTTELGLGFPATATVALSDRPPYRGNYSGHLSPIKVAPSAIADSQVHDSGD